MAGFVTYCIKMILKIILYFLRSKYRKASGPAITTRSASPDRRRASSPVEEHPRRDVNFSNEVSSVHSEISNGTHIHGGEWGTFAEYDVPGEELDFDLEEQKQLLEKLREENRRLQMEVMKQNKDVFDHMPGDVSSSVDVQPSKMTRRRTFTSVDDVFTTRDTNDRVVGKFGSTLLPSADELPLKLTRRRRSMFLSVDDVYTVSDTDFDSVSKIAKWPSVDALPHMFTPRTTRIFTSSSNVSVTRDTDGKENEDVQQISQTGSDERVDGRIKHISDTDARGHTGVDRRNQTEGKNIGDLLRIIKRQQHENSHLKMYINSFMGKILSQQPSLLER